MFRTSPLLLSALLGACATSTPEPSPTQRTPVVDVDRASQKVEPMVATASTRSVSDKQKRFDALLKGTPEPNLLGVGPKGGSGSGSGSSGFERSPWVTSKKLRVSGSLPQDVIVRIMRHNIKHIRPCYRQQLQKEPTLAGQIEVHFVIAETGAVKNVAIKSGMHPKVDACVKSALARMRFPSPKGGVVRVSYPFEFKSPPGQGNAANVKRKRVQKAGKPAGAAKSGQPAKETSGQPAKD